MRVRLISLRKTDGFIRIFWFVLKVMWKWATGRWVFLWIFLAAPLAVWLIAGGTNGDTLPLLVSCSAYAGPAAFVAGWRNSATRSRLSMLLYPSVAGRSSLILPEVVLPVLAGTIPSLGLLAVWGQTAGPVPWQLRTVVPFASISAVSITVILERYLGPSGDALNLLAFLSQGTSAQWALSPIYQLLVPHGYVLWTLRWAQGSGAALHGDIYVFVSVLGGTGLLILAIRILADTGD